MLRECVVEGFEEAVIVVGLGFDLVAYSMDQVISVVISRWVILV